MQDEKLADIELNIAAGINIYKIMQEAIKNALTHSGATNIDVQMENPGENILIRIKDDGRGFNPKTITQGAGLKNMQKRCEDIGGRFYLETGSGRGTKVEVKFGV
jgi:signal transduction histidine kinase